MTDHKIYIIAGYARTGTWLVCWCHTKEEADVRFGLLTQAMNNYKICLRDLLREQQQPALDKLYELDATMKRDNVTYVSGYKIITTSDDNTIASEWRFS